MSVPSMVHRSGGSLIVRSLVSGDALYDRDTAIADVDAEDDDQVLADDPDPDDDDADAEAEADAGSSPGSNTNAKELPDCRVKRNYTCASCDFFTQNPRVYLYHLRDVHHKKVKIYECPNCLYASKHFQKLLRHTKMVHEDAPTPKKTASSEEESSFDSSSITSGPGAAAASTGGGGSQIPSVFKCSVCPFVGKAAAVLTKHEREEHIKTKFFRCSKCTYVTHIKARYTKHVKYHSMPMIKCEMCDFRTPYKWNLDRHCKNHNGHGAFKCSACNFTADIKQSLTVHEMNHHVPPVGQAAGLGVGRRRNKVGASDTTLAEDTLNTTINNNKQPKEEEEVDEEEEFISNKKKSSYIESKNDFIDPDDIVHHSNGKIYFKTKCKYCNFKSPWESEMAKHEKKAHAFCASVTKKQSRPVPNLIPIPPVTKKPKIEPIMSQKDYNDICAKSNNSVLKDLASLFGSEDVFKASSPKVPDLIPATVYTSKNKVTEVFKQKNASFFDSLREKLGTVQNNLNCASCGHESKCLTEHVKHQKNCKESNKNNHTIIPLPNISSSRCQYCRQRCKSSTDLYNHLQNCVEARKALITQNESDEESELKIDESQPLQPQEESINKPHPMENKVFVWNDIVVPMDIEVDDSNYEYTDYGDRIDDNTSLDLSIRTQSPLDSEHSTPTPNSIQHSPIPSTNNEKIPTHGNDISIAQHKRVFKCPHCTFWASTASRFHVHIVGHLNKKPFECSLCSYRSNWRWDITKHIKLKSVRDQAHESAKVLMTDETGRRNYTKYNKYLTEIPVTGAQSLETSGGCGTRPKHHDKTSSPSTSKSDSKSKSADYNQLLKVTASGSPLRQIPALKIPDILDMVDKKRSGGGEGKKTQYKCKKCNFKDASRDILLQHVKGHYQQHTAAVPSPSHLDSDRASTSGGGVSGGGGVGDGGNVFLQAQDLSLRGTSPDKDEASVNNINGGKGGGTAPFRCGHCNQVSNWKHVIQRHCRLKHSGDIRVISNKNGQEKIEMEELTDEPDHVDVPQEGAFRCQSCPFSTDSNPVFDHHMLGHTPTDDSIFKCFYCKYYVSVKEELIEHLKLHGIVDPEEFLLRMAESKVFGNEEGKKFKCIVCPYVTNSKSQYIYHKQFHKPRGGEYTCMHCSYNVSKRHLLHQHLKVHGINVASHKQNGDVVYMDDLNEDIEEMDVDLLQNLPDIPLVWVSKSGKFSKMFKCRYCPHVNLRKVNIQEHEKMHSARENSKDIEHRCNECNYICANAGVLSSHSKVHQGLYGIVHKLVDPSRSDEEQIRELSKNVIIDEVDDVIDTTSGTGTVLYFCKECPARFLKENEFGIHKRFHGSKLQYKCDHCTYTSKEHSHLITHQKVHTPEYQERTKVLQSMYVTSANYPQHKLQEKDGVYIINTINNNNNNNAELSTLCGILNKPIKSHIPLSGTDLYIQKSEAELNYSEPAAPVVNECDASLMRGNPDFIYQPVIKNGKIKEKRYKCHICPTAFEKREPYRIHLTLHGSKQRYKCDLCDYSVKYYANYAQHIKKHKLNDEAKARTSNQTECQHCPYTNTNKFEFDIHTKQHECVSGFSEAFKCDHCDYSASQSELLNEHVKLHFGRVGDDNLEGYMCCDDLKLVDDSDETVFDVKEGLRSDDRFNNNEGEKRFVDVKTGKFISGLNRQTELI